MHDAQHTNPLVTVDNLVKYYPIKGGVLLKEIASVKAVDDVNLTIRQGETLGLVGESGCGKSTLGRTILQLERPTSGTVSFQGQEIQNTDPETMRQLRKKMQIIFQDPFSSLNPRKSISQIIGEPLLVHGMKSRSQRNDAVEQILETVGLGKEHMRRYPHQFSGGQRQRIGIARAIALKPEFIVCDEAVSALDVSIQAQVINLLKDLQEQFNLTYLFISHDLHVVEYISDRVAVMYLGKIVESAASEKLYQNPLHPYTKALLSSSPMPDPTYKRQSLPISGDVPSPINPPPGCRFHTRCPIKRDVCSKEEPKLMEHQPGQFAACFFAKSE
ncbi:MAG: dipeptide ABC transporter ATP-binding protein [Desulfobacteraceae bacterium]|nr:MAG: dipeptide ABC transporter ATP-binding protein [Desulfobacteraceae bacterium]